MQRMTASPMPACDGSSRHGSDCEGGGSSERAGPKPASADPQDDHQRPDPERDPDDVRPDVLRRGQLPQEQAKPGDDEAEPHQGQPRPDPGQKRPLRRKRHARIGRGQVLRFLRHHGRGRREKDLGFRARRGTKLLLHRLDKSEPDRGAVRMVESRCLCHQPPHLGPGVVEDRTGSDQPRPRPRG